ncbi:hypothetical protein ACFOZ7_20420 [Natribaculum luteum]|uniref:Uncharacterized protein n=1 Tax=Natribaculum luteum TaxID=1586232 RepID=A0ABD5P5E5_9EURY|nr:hypothetical protein [Natribaculum luteum]
MYVVTQLHAALEAMKHPSYTGENRCRPCTILNLVIAAVLAIAVASAVAEIDGALAVGAGVATFAGAVTIVYFRGYLIPGTPTITKRYVPDRFLALFDETPTRIDRERRDPAESLLEVGVVVDDPDADDLVLDRAFAGTWERSIEAHWTDETEIRESLGQFAKVDSTRLELDERPQAVVAWADDAQLANWPSRAACVADAAAAAELPAWDPNWEHYPLALRWELLGMLRLFIEHCPACGGTVALSQDVVESCCRRRDVVAATCVECDARLFEMDVDPTELEDE